MTQMFKIRNDLIEAYKGYYEDYTWVQNVYARYEKVEGRNGKVAVEDFQTWLTDWVQKKIVSDSPKERLERYLEWNGISGYTNTIYEIATGSISV